MFKITVLKGIPFQEQADWLQVGYVLSVGELPSAHTSEQIKAVVAVGPPTGGQVFLLWNGGRKLLECERRDTAMMTVLTPPVVPVRTKVLFNFKPWDEERDFPFSADPDHKIICAYLGWHALRWHDGALGLSHGHGDLSTYIPLGGSQYLQIATTDFYDPAWEFRGGRSPMPAKNICHNAGASLTCAIRELFAVELRGSKNATLKIARPTLEDLLAVVLFRKAFPDMAVFVAAQTEYKQWPAFAKRICQNIGVNMYERRAPAGPPVIDLSRMQGEIATHARALAQDISRPSDVIPRSLWHN